MTIREIADLAICVAKGEVPAEYAANYSVENAEDAVRAEFKALAGDNINTFLKNQHDIFEIMIETVDRVVPNKVIDAMSQFCEIRNVKFGETVMFKRGLVGRNRAKMFLTQVGLNGVYESFRLDSETFKIAMKAIGGAVSLDWQRYLDGAENLADLMDVIAEAQVDGIYLEVQKALMAAVSNMPARNKKVGSYDAAELQKIVNTVKAYGGYAVIMAPPEFVDAMGPDAIVPAITGAAQGIYPVDDIDTIHKAGRVKLFRGTPIVEFKQSFWDGNNAKIMINPQYAYILPSNNKVVKVVMEGPTQMWTLQNADRSIEVETERMIGIGITTYNNWGIYQNTDISDSDWYDADLGGLGNIMPKLNPAAQY